MALEAIIQKYRSLSGLIGLVERIRERGAISAKVRELKRDVERVRRTDVGPSEVLGVPCGSRAFFALSDTHTHTRGQFN